MADIIDINEIKRIAFVARLNMNQNENELKENIREINEVKDKIINRVLLINIDKDDFLPDTELTNTFREDIALPSLAREEVLLNAGKNIEAGCISVPKILGKGEES